MPDYRSLMDGETWAFIDRVNAFYPPDAIHWPIEKARAVYDQMSRGFHAGRPAGVDVEDRVIETATHPLPVRLYRNARPNGAAHVLFLHGGGFVLGGLDSHDDICADICARTGFGLVSVDYQLAPEHRGTSALDDSAAAYHWLAGETGRPIVLLGESAGGTLAASLAHALRDHPPPPLGQVLVYPSLGGPDPKPSRALHALAPLLTAGDLDFYDGVRSADDTRTDPRFEPLGAADFAGLPPTVIIAAECDPLASDGPLFRDRILAAGGRAFCHEAARLPHGFLRARATVSRAAAEFSVVVETVARLGRGEWPHS
ncbi:MAG: esterase [Mesorhizobium amorphae]|nr:MAG: esterase [Mesorhizobium amorphae]